MKKFILSIILALFVCATAHADLITFDNISSFGDLTVSRYNNNLNTIYNEFNGGISGNNVRSSTLTHDNMAANSKGSTYQFENLGDYTFTGMLPATSANLTSDISPGTSYLSGLRLLTAATSHTYTASRDTYVYIDQNGTFQFQEVALGASQPSDPANSIILAKVVTDANNITSVTDLRQLTPPNVRINQDLKLGVVLSRDISTATTVNIGRGTIDFGTGITLRRNTITADVAFTTTGRGGLDTGSLAEGYYAIWAVPDDDNTTAYEGVASTSFTATSLAITGERLIGWCYAPSASEISPDSIGAYRGVGGDAPNFIKRIGATDTSTTSTSLVDIEGMDVRFYTSGRPLLIRANIPFSAGGATHTLGFSMSLDTLELQSIYGSNASWSGDANLAWAGKVDAGTYTLHVKWVDEGGNTITSNGATIGADGSGQRVVTIQEL